MTQEQHFQFELITWGQARPIVFVRTRTPVEALPAVIGEAYGRIMPHVSAQGVEAVEPPYVAYFNDDMADMDVEIGVVISKAIPGQGDIQVGELPAGQVAACMYKGPYNGVGVAHDALMQWAKAEGHTITGVAYEFYISDPEETAPEDLLTQICHPLAAG
ncbi:MAG: GyrI-like domain-containing protein [Chloroflexi bacterium]|nr:GyrI-like domain-containing protein [Chloroflexota bacterium]